MTKFLRSRLAGLDLLIIAAFSAITAGLAAPFALRATAEDPVEETDEEKKKRMEEEEAKKKAKAEDDEKMTDEEKKKKEPEASASAARPSLSACLAGALAALKGGTPALSAAALKTEQAAHAATQATLTQTQADLTAARASLASSETALAAVCGFLGLKASDLSAQPAAEVTKIVQAKIGAEAIAQIASIGINPGRLPAPTAAVTADSKTMTKAEFDALTPAQKSKFSVAGGRLTD